MDLLSLNLNKETPDLPTTGELRFQAGLLAAVSATAAGFLARFLFGAPLVPELVAQFIFSIAPIWMVEIAVGLLGPFAKHLAFLGCTALYVIALIGAAIVYARYHPANASARRFAPYAFALFVFAVTGVAVIPLIGGGLLGGHLYEGALLTTASLLAVHVVYGVALSLSIRRYIERPVANASAIVSRRRFIRGVGYAVLALGVFDIAKSLIGSWLQSGSGRVTGGDGVFPNIDSLALEVTPTPDFYQVSKNAFDPHVDLRSWKLEVAGMVGQALNLTLEDLMSLPPIEQYATLCCISNEVGGDLIGNARWRGVRLRDVLERAGPSVGVVDIVLRARDDYADSIPLERALGDGTLLVYEMNGEPLSPEHGFPLRLIVPGIYGMKNVKWITRIEAVGYDFKGYWQRRGWDDRAEYKTMSRIDAPTTTVKEGTAIAGIAFAGDRGISKVEVSTDGGRTWESAEIKSALSPFTWVLWQKQWSPDRSGKHRVVVRATDGRDVTQTAQYAPPAPDGSSGYHSVVIESE